MSVTNDELKELAVSLKTEATRLRMDGELAECLRGAVTAMELLDHYVEPDYTPGLPALIERSKAALKVLQVNVNLTRALLVASIAIWGVVFYRAASAQTLGDHTTCYSWNGGNHSSGSFIQCDTWKAPVKVAAVLPPPVQPSPVMMPMSAPVTCAPPPKPVLHKHKPKKQC